MAAASGEYFFLLNPDTELDVAAIATLKSVLDDDQSAVIAAPHLLNSDGTLQRSVWKRSGLRQMIEQLQKLDDVGKTLVFGQVQHDAHRFLECFSVKFDAAAGIPQQFSNV